MNTTPNFSIIVPVLNEAERINEAVDHIRDQQVDEGVEIIVVDGDRAGSTIKAVTDDEVVKLTAARGRGCQMNRGAAFAKGDVLLFLHVDTRLPPNALALILSALHEKRIVAGAFDLGFNTTRKIFTVTEKYVSVRTRLTRVPFGDQAIFIRRDYFEKIGEYAEIPLMEDVELMKRIRKRGDKIAIIPEKVKTLPRRYEQEGILYCTLRNWVLQLFYALGVAPERLAKWYQ
jgi:rSAM/selenodomain-associated transferase 2